MMIQTDELLVNKMGGVAIEEFVGVNPKIYLNLVINSGEYKKAKVGNWLILVNVKKAKIVNKNVVTKISHNVYKEVLLNKKCLRHLINRIRSKNLKIEVMIIMIIIWKISVKTCATFCSN